MTWRPMSWAMPAYQSSSAPLLIRVMQQLLYSCWMCVAHGKCSEHAKCLSRPKMGLWSVSR